MNERCNDTTEFQVIERYDHLARIRSTILNGYIMKIGSLSVNRDIVFLISPDHQGQIHRCLTSLTLAEISLLKFLTRSFLILHLYVCTCFTLLSQIKIIENV